MTLSGSETRQGSHDLCLAYETVSRVDNTKAATSSRSRNASEPKPLVDFLEELGDSFPFESGITLTTRKKNIFLSKNGYLQGKSWKVIGVCRQGNEPEPYIILLKTKADTQLAIIQYKELLSIGYVPLVTTRVGTDAANSPGLRFCCNSDCSIFSLWTSSSLQSYSVSGVQKNKVCRKFELCARTSFGEGRSLLACKFNKRAGNALITLSHSHLGFQFRTFQNALDLSSSVELGTHNLRLKLQEVGLVSLNYEESNQALLSTTDGRFYIIDARLGAISQNVEKANSPVKSVAWHPLRGLALCMSDKTIFALDQALQPIKWTDKVQGDRKKLKITDLIRGAGEGSNSVLSWDSGSQNTATVTSVIETVQFSLSSSELQTFGKSHDIILSYMRTQQWAKMKCLLECAYLTSSDLKSLMNLVEDMAKTSSIDNVSAWRIFSLLLKHVASIVSQPDKAGDSERASFKRIALDYLSKGRYEAAVLIASDVKSAALSEFLYTYMMQNQEARLANICWDQLKNNSGSKPKAGFAPATLKALQMVSA